MGWLWLDIAREAEDALTSANTNYRETFYRQKIRAMQFYYTYELPKTIGLTEVLLNQEGITLESPTDLFG